MSSSSEPEVPDHLLKKPGEAAEKLISVLATFSDFGAEDAVLMMQKFIKMRNNGDFKQIGLTSNASSLQEDYLFAERYLGDFIRIFQERHPETPLLANRLRIPHPSTLPSGVTVFSHKQLEDIEAVKIPQAAVKKIVDVLGRHEGLRAAAQDVHDMAVMTGRRFGCGFNMSYAEDFIDFSRNHIPHYEKRSGLSKSAICKLFDEIDGGNSKKRKLDAPRLVPDLSGYTFLVREDPPYASVFDELQFRGARIVCAPGVGFFPRESPLVRPTYCIGSRPCENGLKEMERNGYERSMCCFTWEEIVEALSSFPHPLMYPLMYLSDEDVDVPHRTIEKNTSFFLTCGVFSEKFCEYAVTAGGTYASIIDEDGVFKVNHGHLLGTKNPKDVTVDYLVRHSQGITFPCEENMIAQLYKVHHVINEKEFMNLVLDRDSALDKAREAVKRLDVLEKELGTYGQRVTHLEFLHREVSGVDVEYARKFALLAMAVRVSDTYPPREFHTPDVAEGWSLEVCTGIVENEFRLAKEDNSLMMREKYALDRYVKKLKDYKLL